MSLLSVPFVDSSTDIVLHVVAAFVMIASVSAIGFGFWKIHELPVSKAKKKEHHQLGLITALTWIGFVWHWVWVLAVFVAFIDGEKALRHIRDIWRETPSSDQPEEKRLTGSSNQQEKTHA